MCTLSMTHASLPQDRHVYTLRAPRVNRRRAVEIIDLATFDLTNSEDGRPKPMIPFLLTLAETRTDLSDESIENVEYAIGDFLLAELKSHVFEWGSVSNVNAQIVSQERIVEEIDERKLHHTEERNGFRGRQLRSVPGSQFEVWVNVTFNREPSPRTSLVDQVLQQIMQPDLRYLVNNITATEDPELGYVFMAYREEISAGISIANETPTTITADIQEEVEEPKAETQSMKFIIPILIGLVMLGAIIALFVVKRKRRRVQAATQKAHSDLAFLDEETNLFSYENSPTKSSTKKPAKGIDTSNDYDADEEGSSRSLTSSQASPSYGLTMSALGSPTAKPSLSGAETVKVSNARLMPLPSKLTELASTSLFAFSEEEEDYEDSAEENNSQRTSASQQPSDVSNGSSFNRLMSGKSDEEGILSITSSPRHEVAPVETPTGQSSVSSFFSSHFFSGAASALTEQAANTTQAAVKKKASRQGVRSFSLSPRVDKSGSPFASGRARAKSVTDGDDDSADSVFDFIVPSPKKSRKDLPKNVQDSEPSDDMKKQLEPPGQATTGASPAALSTPTGTALSTPIAEATASPSSVAVVTAAILSSVAEAASVAATPPTVLKSNVTSKANLNSNATSSSTPTSANTNDNAPKAVAESESSVLNPITYLKKVALGPRNQNHPTAVTNPQAHLRHYTPDAYDGVMSEEDSLSDAPGSFPRRSRRHAKSTTHDGTSAYQTNAMQPQDWSMTDGCSDDDTLSEQGGGAGFGAFPKTGLRKKSERPSDMSPANHSRSSYSAVTQSSLTSKADSSQASASRQLINDLVWLSKKIAGVKQSAVESAPGESSALGAPPQIEQVDSLSYASQDGLISPTSETDAQGTFTSPTLPDGPRNGLNTSVICRDCHAPPGKLNIVIHSTKDGPAVFEVKEGSCLDGKVYPGDLIIAVDGTDTRAFTAAQLMRIMSEKSEADRKITVLHFEDDVEGTEDKAE
jgi:hypothetical protein